MKRIVQTIIYILKRAQIRPRNTKNPYELWVGRPTSIRNLRIVGSKGYIKRDEEHLGKFDSRFDEDIFLGYFMRSKVYICDSKILWKIV